jgi:hypothetical protein
MISLCLSKDFFSAREIRSELRTHTMSQAAVDARLSAAVGRPVWPVEEERQPNLNISVIFTAVDPTLAALKCAGRLAGDLGARISLVVAQVVPYPLPLDRPPVSQEFSERRFRVIAGESRVETNVAVYFCRDRMATLKAVLRPHSLVVVGGRKRRWSRAWAPTREKRLARELRRAGHEVIFSEME